MTKRKWALIVTALLLACVYIYHFTGWFKPKIIQISYTDRSLPSRTLLLRRRTSSDHTCFGFG